MFNKVNAVPKPSHNRRVPKQAQRSVFREPVRKEIKRRDKICRECKKAEIEEIHHVKPRSLGGRGVLTNGIGFCRSCHQKVEADSKLKRIWQERFKVFYGNDYYKDEYEI